MDNENIEQLKQEIKNLKERLNEKELLLQTAQQNLPKSEPYQNLSENEIVRYSRQILTPQLKLPGQISLKNSKVLIVGMGGLGCPAALYLASAGVGELTILDYDEVELSNLHRQILHSELDIGQPKVNSAYRKLQSINGNITINPVKLHANSTTLKELAKAKKFNVVLDGSDNVATRYLLNDFCVLNNIPLISGSALQMEGQLTVYNYNNGPCYRCLFPKPPPPETVTNCGDGGVLGPVPGAIGTLQALEAIKILSKAPGVLSGRLLLFDGSSMTFRNVKLREKVRICRICGDNPDITDLIDYEQFCGAKAHDKVVNIDILQPHEHIDVQKFSEMVRDFDKVVIDVRPEIEYEMCNLPNTINIPYSHMQKGVGLESLNNILNDELKDVYVLCRRGNDSQRAIVYLKEKFNGSAVNFYNVKGGLHSYSTIIDAKFPIY